MARRGDGIYPRFSTARWVKALVRMTLMFGGGFGFLACLLLDQLLLAAIFLVIGVGAVLTAPTPEDLVPGGKIWALYVCLITGSLGLLTLWGATAGVWYLLVFSAVFWAVFYWWWLEQKKPIERDYQDGIQDAIEERLRHWKQEPLDNDKQDGRRR